MPPDHPETEVLVTAACWQAEPEAEAIILRAIDAAAVRQAAARWGLDAPSAPPWVR